MPSDKEVTDNNTSEIDKIHESVLAICDKFEYEIMRCVKCPILKECRYSMDKLKPLYAEALKISKDIYEEEIELDNTAENVLRAQQKRDYVYSAYIQDNAYKVLENNRCKYEKEEILTSLQKFVDAGYDITDPRVYMIVKELISNLLTSGRANKTFTNLGVLLRKDTPSGPYYYQNPLLKIKVEFSKLIIEATEALDRILKSDEQAKADSDFTKHLLQQLGLHKAKKRQMIGKVIDAVQASDNTITDEEEDDN